MDLDETNSYDGNLTLVEIIKEYDDQLEKERQEYKKEIKNLVRRINMGINELIICITDKVLGEKIKR